MNLVAGRGVDRSVSASMVFSFFIFHPLEENLTLRKVFY